MAETRSFKSKAPDDKVRLCLFQLQPPKWVAIKTTERRHKLSIRIDSRVASLKIISILGVGLEVFRIMFES